MTRHTNPIEAAGLFFSGRRASGKIHIRAALVDREYNELAYTVTSLEQLVKLRDQINTIIETGMRYEHPADARESQ